VNALTSHRVFEAERGRLRNNAQRVDELVRRSETGLVRQLERARDFFRRAGHHLAAFGWERQIAERQERVTRQRDRLVALGRTAVERRRSSLARFAGMLESLSPLAVLSRGYALVWDASGQRLLRGPDDVAVGDALRVRLQGGGLTATVTGKESA
jgi:exodeoxyribonuclease VII large subunit